MDWASLINNKLGAILESIGESRYHLPTDYNPVTRALKNPDFVSERKGKIAGFNRTNLSKLATICQMAVFDNCGGPEGDGKGKGLRRQWYAWYKTEFALPLSVQYGEDPQSEKWGKNWNGRQSQTYGWLVDNCNVTYKDLWVDDASRMMEQNWNVLFRDCHIIIAVEKDSLFADFTSPAAGLGAKAVYSGKGKSSKAAIEKLLREHFGWSEYSSPFSRKNPLIVLHISDHDYDGEAVIGPTFAQQCRRYTSHILEARVGIRPENVKANGYKYNEKWYQVKVGNSAYIKWANAKALFLATCEDCSTEYPVVGTDRYGYSHNHTCPKCGGLHDNLVVKVDLAHGFEVEALTTRSYRSLLVYALLQVLPFDYIVSRLRDECKADQYNASSTIQKGILKENESYKALLEEFDRLEEIKQEFERRIRDTLERLGEPHTSDWREIEDDPAPEDYVGHVEDVNGRSSPWRPFSTRKRTARLVEFLREQETATIADFVSEKIDW